MHSRYAEKWSMGQVGPHPIQLGTNEFRCNFATWGARGTYLLVFTIHMAILGCPIRSGHYFGRWDRTLGFNKAQTSTITDPSFFAYKAHVCHL